MFEGEKEAIFWLGLMILGFASIVLFSSLWQFGFIHAHQSVSGVLKSSSPYIVGGVVFILIGLYMMKSGAKKP